MTARSPDTRLSRLARGPKRAPGLQSPEPEADRIFVTMLSLNFMLLAFFVVLGTTASYDRTRAASVVQSVRIAFTGEDENGIVATARLTARQALQAGVSEAFADVLPAIRRFKIENKDRVDVALPHAALRDVDGTGVQAMLADGVARLLRSAPAGFHYELLLDGGETSDAATDFAAALVDRDVEPRALLIGNQATDDAVLHFSFLVFEGETDDVGAATSADLGAAAMARAHGGLTP